MKRVGVSRENEWRSGSVNWRWVAIARFSITSAAEVGSEDEVGTGGFDEAMDRRRLLSGSRDMIAV
jgi:hypothetical protein